MGNCHSSKKVIAHLEVEGECGGVDRLSLSRPCSKGGRHVLASFVFPVAREGADHRVARKIAVPVGRLAKKDGTTPVRLDFLAGDTLVARREIPLAALLEGLRANTIGRRSALFFSLKGGQAQHAQALDDIAVFYSRRLLDSPKSEQPQDTLAAKIVPTPVPMYPEADHTVDTLEFQFMEVDLMTEESWELPQSQHVEESQALPIFNPHYDQEAVPTLPSAWRLWLSPQPHLWNRRQEPRGTSSGGEEEPVSQHVEESEAVPTLFSPWRWDSPQSPLRRRRKEPRGTSSEEKQEPVLSERSTRSPHKHGKAPPRAGRDVCVPCMFLQCAQLMTFTLLVHQVLLHWW